VRDIATIWQEFLKIVQEEAGSRVVETWFKAVRMLNWDARNKVVQLEAPNEFVKSWISQHYMDLLDRHLSRLLNEPYVHVRFTHARKHETPSPAHDGEQTSFMHTTFQPARLSIEHQSSSRFHSRKRRKRKASSVRVRGPLNGSYVFDSFVVGSSNTLAFSAAHATAQQPGDVYNPLYIYGASGLGKTHLLHAVGNYLKSGQERALVMYQSADHFVSEFMKAIRSNNVYDFESRYKDVDILLFDDVQCIANKEQTQEIFSHICNTLAQSSKQVIVTSNTSPRDMSGVSERVKSHLEGGLIADIHEPSLELKVSILQKKAALHNEHLSLPLAQHIASYHCTNVRELEATLLRVIAFSSLTKQPLTQELISDVCDSQRVNVTATYDLKTVATYVAYMYRYSLADLRSAKRNKDLTFVRHIAMYAMKQYTCSSLQEIAAFLSRKDHTTVMYACEKIERQRCNNTHVVSALEQLERKLMAS